MEPIEFGVGKLLGRPRDADERRVEAGLPGRTGGVTGALQQRFWIFQNGRFFRDVRLGAVK